MICPNCGKEVKDGLHFCPFCGASLTDVYSRKAEETSSMAGEKAFAKEDLTSPRIQIISKKEMIAKSRVKKTPPMPNMPNSIGINSNADKFWSKFFSIKGRIGRFTFIKRMILSSLIMWTCVLVTNKRIPYVSDVTMILVFVGLFSCFCLMCQRLHDSGKSALWMLLWAIPYINLYMLYPLLIKSGTEGPNQYGDRPGSSGII